MGGTRAPRVVHSRPGGDDERRMLEAMLLAVGDLGFANVSVQDVIARAGTSRSAFYRHFRNKEECFARGYAMEAELLCENMLRAACSRAGWPNRLRVALAELLRFATDQPVLARALLIEAHVARGPVLVTFEKVVERLTHAVDSARNEDSQHSPPPLTAEFIIATVQYSIQEWLRGDRREDGMTLLPGLVHFGVLYYFGEAAAQNTLGGT